METQMLRLSLILALLLTAAPTLADQKAGKFCPPGLAKKTPACVPPGLARQWHPGDIIEDRDGIHIITYPLRYGLPPLGPGERYVVIGGQILKVNLATWEVLTLFQAIEILLD